MSEHAFAELENYTSQTIHYYLGLDVYLQFGVVDGVFRVGKVEHVIAFGQRLHGLIRQQMIHLHRHPMILKTGVKSRKSTVSIEQLIPR